MNRQKLKKLEKRGWKAGSVDDFLGLSPEESAFIEVKLKLADALTQRRKKESLTQVQLAQRIQSSQSRVAKMESGDPSVSMDLLVKALLCLGITQSELARIIDRKTTPEAA